LLLGIAVVMSVVELVAYKIPSMDSVHYAIYAFIRVPAGALFACEC
jgi:hypothetical protein